MQSFIYSLLIVILFVAQSMAQQVPPSYDTVLYLNPETPIYFKYIPAGTFSMGSNTEDGLAEKDEIPAHKVTLSKGFYMGVFEVTQAQWKAITGENPAIFRVFEDSPNRPVEYVTWNQVDKYIEKLNELNLGKFRLPTEAEWEYACRAGTQSPYYWGSEMAVNGSSEYAWANSRSHSSTNPVGMKKPNAWGLYDMSGNVWEWCSDWYGPYSAEPKIDPTGPKKGKLKVFRGGSWFDFYESHRSANRHKHAPNEPYSAIGLRLVWEN